MVKVGQKVWQIGCFKWYYSLPLISRFRVFGTVKWQVIPKKRKVVKIGKKGYCFDEFLNLWDKKVFVHKKDAIKYVEKLNKKQRKKDLDFWIKELNKNMDKSVPWY